MISKEDFNKIWSNTSKEGILNQFYYEHNELKELYKKVDKAIELIKKCSAYDEETKECTECITYYDGDEILAILKEDIYED